MQSKRQTARRIAFEPLESREMLSADAVVSLDGSAQLLADSMIATGTVTDNSAAINSTAPADSLSQTAGGLLAGKTALSKSLPSSADDSTSEKQKANFLANRYVASITVLMSIGLWALNGGTTPSALPSTAAATRVSAHTNFYAGRGQTTISAGTLSVSSSSLPTNSGTLTVGSLTDTSDLIKTGTGTWTLMPSSGYTGTTTINNGTLTVGGGSGALIYLSNLGPVLSSYPVSQKGLIFAHIPGTLTLQMPSGPMTFTVGDPWNLFDFSTLP